MMTIRYAITVVVRTNYSALRGSERAVVQFPMLLIQTLNYNDVV